MGGNGHDGAGAVTGQHIFRNPHRNLFAGERIHAVRAGEHARNRLSGNAFALGLFLHLFQVGFYLRFLRSAGELRDPLALRSQHHEGDAKNGVRPGGEDGHIVLLAVAGDLKHHFCALAAANPVALHLLQGVRPVQTVQSVQQPAGISAHTQLPLGHFLLEHRMAAPLGEAVLHLVVGQDRSQGRAPVHGAFSLIGNAVAHENIGLFLFGESLPLLCRKGRAFAAGSVHGSRATFLEGRHQFFNGTGFFGIFIVPAAEHFQESPLRPLIIIRVAGAEFAVPVEGEANAVQLLTVAGHVVVGGLFRMLSCLDGVLLGRKAEGIVAHGMQYVEALQPRVAGEDIAGDIAQRMAHMQARTTGVREHVQHVIFGFVGIYTGTVGLVLGPPLLPLLLNL